MTIASYISCFRVLLVFPIIFLSFEPHTLKNFIALILFIFAALSDYVDGYIARKTNTVTDLGALLDLWADKLFVCLLLVWIVSLSNSLIVTVPSLFIIAREITISLIRQHLVELGRVAIRVSKFGKFKTVIQMVAIGFMLLSSSKILYISSIGVFLLWFSAILSLLSLYNYLTELNSY